MDYDCRIEKLCEGVMSWIDEFSKQTRDEREETYEHYRWMFSDDCKNLPTLEPLISDARVKTYRDRFKEWFRVVVGYSLSPEHLGQASYSHFLNDPYWKGSKTKGNKVYPQRVILALGMAGIFNGVKTDYLYIGDKTKDHPRVYTLDLPRLQGWMTTSTGCPDGFSETTSTSPLEESWVMSCSLDDSDFDYSFLEGDDGSWDLYNDWYATRQRDTLYSLEVLPECYEKAQMFLDTSPYRMVDDLSKEKKKIFRVQYRNCKWLVALHNGDVGRCKVDDAGGRFYSLMVGMGKEYRRNCLHLNGERIVEVDVSSSQPTMIGLKVKKDTGITTQWLSHCLSGDFYEWVKSITGVKVKRDKVKKYVMRYLFSCYGPDLPKTYEGEHLPPDGSEGKKGYKKFEWRLTSFLKENEPEVYHLIETHKRHPSWTEKVWTDRYRKKHYGKWCSTLPVEMQKVEVEFIKTCISRLPGQMLFYTIHDAICVKESDGEKVKRVMQEVSLDLYGEKVGIKVENKD